MSTRTLPHDAQSRLLASGERHAIATMAIAELPNTLLVQLHGLRKGRGPAAFSLFAVYREASMSFEAIVRFEPLDLAQALGPMLLQFVDGAEFQRELLAPLIHKRRAHFRR